MKLKPTQEQAIEAEETLSNAILEFSNSARAPWERNEPLTNPTWVPRPSTLRYSPLRGGDYIWSMDANDQQIVAFYIPDVIIQVTAHGHARANFHEMLRKKHIFPTQSPYTQWYDYRKQMELDDKMKKKVVW